MYFTYIKFLTFAQNVRYVASEICLLDMWEWWDMFLQAKMCFTYTTFLTCGRHDINVESDHLREFNIRSAAASHSFGFRSSFSLEFEKVARLASERQMSKALATIGSTFLPPSWPCAGLTLAPHPWLAPCFSCWLRSCYAKYNCVKFVLLP